MNITQPVSADTAAAATLPPARLHLLPLVQLACALMIVVRHYAHYLASAWPEWAAMLGRIDFVEFFFCSSGFVIHYASRGVLPPLFSLALPLRQLRKIYPLHLVTTLVFLAIIIVSGSERSLKGESLERCTGMSLTLLHAFDTIRASCMNYPSWFLSAIFGLYLLYPLLARLAARLGVAGMVVLVAVVVAGLEMVPDSRIWTRWTYHWGFLRGIPSFMAGIIIADALPRLARWAPPLWAAIPLFCLSIFGAMAGEARLISFFLLQLALLAVVVAGEAGRPEGTSIPAWLSRWSGAAFPVYLLHAPMSAILINFVALRMLHLKGAAIAIALLGTACLTLIVARLYPVIAARLGIGASRN